MTYFDKLKQDHPEESESLKAVEIGEVVRAGLDAGMKDAETYSHEEVKNMFGIDLETVKGLEKAATVFGSISVECTDDKTKWEEEYNNPDKANIITQEAVEEAIKSFKNSIKDSGDRTQFATGAVRDMHEGKGRCDLLPLDVVGVVYDYIEEDIMPNWLFIHFYNFQQDGDINHLLKVLECFNGFDGSIETMFLEVAKHFEDGAKKYGEYNWQKGIPVNCYIDSAVRHYLKYLRGDEDERHDRAFVWNILCCIWTCKHKPELNTYLKEKENGN